MNWIQQHILLELTRHSERRYSELRPDGVEGNLFLYHLDGLMREGKVTKTDKQYQLTDKGKQETSRLSLETGKVRLQPQILTAIICQNKQGEYLLFRWARQPNLDMLSLPHGMLHFGESVTTAAERELAEKAGLKAVLEYVGEVYIKVFRGEGIEGHMLVHLVKATDTSVLEDAVRRTDLGESFWSQTKDIKKSDWLPGFGEIINMVQQPADGHIYGEVVVRIPEN